jgi:uncharacterized protein YdaU (DUF1376 family)
MSMKRPWYKRYPDHFIAGTLHLTFEQRAAYSMLIDLAHGGERTIPNDDRMISAALGIRIQRWKRLKSSLNLAGKLKESSKNLSITPSQPIEIIESGVENKNREEKKEKPTKERQTYGPRYNTQDSLREAIDAINRRAAAGLDPFATSGESGGENIVLLPGLRKNTG